MAVSPPRARIVLPAFFEEQEDRFLQAIADFHDPEQEWRRLFSELYGTFFLVLVAAGGGMMSQAFPGTITRTAAVVAPSERMRRWAEHHGARREQLRVVPPGVDPADHPRLANPPDHPVIAWVGPHSELPVLLLRTDLGAGTDVMRLLEIKPDLEVGITVGAGHFHQLEVPEQVNAMIERFLALSL